MTEGRVLVRDAVLVALLAVVPFLPALGNRFAFDDTLASVLNNHQGIDPVIHDPHPPWYFFGQHYWLGEDHHDSRLYRPLTILGYAWTWHAIGKRLLPEGWPQGWEKLDRETLERRQHLEALPHHAINLLLHAWAACLVLWLMLALGLCRTGALLTACLFAVHALHSEVVAGIVGRAELLSFCFGALGLRLFIRAERGKSAVLLPLAGLAFFLALCSKESAVAWLPFLPCLLAVRAWRLHEGLGSRALATDWRKVLAVTLPPLAVFLVLRGIALWGLKDDVFYPANPLYHEAADVRLMTAVAIFGYALWKCVWPCPLACLYGLQAIPLVTEPTDPRFLGALVALAAWLAFGLWRPARAPLSFAAVALFFGFAILTSNVPFAIGTIFAERLYFAPSLGVCMLPALLLPRVPRWGRHVVVGLCAVWIAACAVVDWRRSPVWADNPTLMLNDAVVQPDCASLQLKASEMHRWLIDADKEQADFHRRESWRLLRRARELDPGYVRAAVVEAGYLVTEERFADAVAQLERALAMPRLPVSNQEVAIRTDLGGILIERMGRVREGIEHLRRALVLRPRELSIRLFLLDHGMGVLAPEEARALLIESSEAFPGIVLLHGLQASFVHHYGEYTEANWLLIVQILEDVLPRGPAALPFLRLRLVLANAYGKLGRMADARREYEAVRDAKEATAKLRAAAEEGLAGLPG